jgi:hypothetical protein
LLLLLLFYDEIDIPSVHSAEEHTILIIISVLLLLKKLFSFGAAGSTTPNRQLVKHAAGQGSRQKEHGRTLSFVKCEVAVSRLG